MIDPVEFIRAFPIASTTCTSRTRPERSTGGRASSRRISISATRAGLGFPVTGRGQVNFEEIAPRLNHIGYEGPLSVEWEDCGMDREYGAAEAARFVKEKMGFNRPGGCSILLLPMRRAKS